MSNARERAVEMYVEAWGERDPVLRMKLLETCFAENGRVVTRGREIRGRVALAETMAQVQSDPRFQGVRITSAIDAEGPTFRVRGVALRSDGTTPEGFDAGEFDSSGRICLVLTFAGPLADR